VPSEEARGGDGRISCMREIAYRPVVVPGGGWLSTDPALAALRRIGSLSDRSALHRLPVKDGVI